MAKGELSSCVLVQQPQDTQRLCVCYLLRHDIEVADNIDLALGLEIHI